MRRFLVFRQFTQCRDGLRSGSDVKFKSKIILSVGPWVAWSRHGRVLLFSKESYELLTVSVVVVSEDRKTSQIGRQKLVRQFLSLWLH